jgi:hypothetical protein
MKKAKDLVLVAAMVLVMVLPGVSSIEAGAGNNEISPLDKGDRGEQIL